jgi:uncharacterized membrane protein
VPLALFVAYPLLAHLGVMLGAPLLQWLALQCLFAGVFFRVLRGGAARAWVALAAFAIGTWLLTASGDGLYALYLPPLVLTGLACAAFVQSLRPGQVPLVTRIATGVHGTLSPPLAAHTVTVTRIWAVLLASMFAITLALTLAGAHAAWSLFTNFISYALMGLMFAAEFAWRRLRFPDQDSGSFIAYIRLVARSGAGRP